MALLVVGRPEDWKFYRDSRDAPELVADPGRSRGLLGYDDGIAPQLDHS